MSEWIVSLPDRLDSFLASGGRMLSRAKAQKAIEDGRVFLNNEKVSKPSERLQEGDQVRLTEEEALTTDASFAPKDLELPMLYEDDMCFVINKPAGYAVHPGAGTGDEPTILHGIAYLFRQRRLPFSEDSTLVHRLDKGTTGCLLIAKNPEAHMMLQKQFETRTVKKTYLALVAGTPAHPTATIDASIGRSQHNRTKMGVSSLGDARDAQTTYRTVATADHAVLLECDLHTGRTHQIRVHLLSIGHPVLGDDTYRNSLSERLTEEFAISGLCLHSWKLRFISPTDQKEHEVIAELPKNFQETLGRLQIKFQ